MKDRLMEFWDRLNEDGMRSERVFIAIVLAALLVAVAVGVVKSC